MPDENWESKEARLIPVSGISGVDEQERRATSALLAVVTAVPQFAKALLGPLGAPVGKLSAFVEVHFELEDRRVIPDGLIRCERAGRTWTALVEVKTGSNKLKVDQLESYLDVARFERFDAILTISNEIAGILGGHPTPVDRRKLKKVVLLHYSWARVLSEAVLEGVHRGVNDPEQAWILGELIRYLEHPKSGARDFDDMGDSWTSCRDAIEAGTLRPSDDACGELLERWDQLVRYTTLGLMKELGVDVQVQLAKKEEADLSVREQRLRASLCDRGFLDATIKIGILRTPLTIGADLRARQVSCSIDVNAPREGRNSTRVNWLVKQLADSPPDLRVEAFAAHARQSTSVLLSGARQDTASLVPDGDRELRTFRLTQVRRMGLKRSGRGGFIASVVELVDDFYEHVARRIRPWEPPPPRPRKGAGLADSSGDGASREQSMPNERLP